MAAYKKPTMAQYWIDTVGAGKDDFRTYVTNPAIFERINRLEKSLEILDFGCGEGYLSRYMSTQGHKVTGIDESEHFIRYAQINKFNKENYIVANISKGTQFSPETFDMIVANFVLPEFKDLNIPIKEMARLLRPNGRLLIQTLNPAVHTANSGTTENKTVTDYFKVIRFNEKFEINGKQSPLPVTRYHHPLRNYTQALKDNGFTITEIDEPQPIRKTPKNHIIRKIMKDPWFLLIEAQKK